LIEKKQLYWALWPVTNKNLSEISQQAWGAKSRDEYLFRPLLFVNYYAFVVVASKLCNDTSYYCQEINYSSMASGGFWFGLADDSSFVALDRLGEWLLAEFSRWLTTSGVIGPLTDLVNKF
jgi:hypothetical protein